MKNEILNKVNEQLDSMIVEPTKELFKSLKNGDRVMITYKYNKFGKDVFEDFIIWAYEYESIGTQLAVRAGNGMLGSMNIEKITDTRLVAYDYSMMSQRSNYSFKFEDMLITEVEGGYAT